MLPKLIFILLLALLSLQIVNCRKKQDKSCEESEENSRRKQIKLTPKSKKAPPPQEDPPPRGRSLSPQDPPDDPPAPPGRKQVRLTTPRSKNAPPEPPTEAPTEEPPTDPPPEPPAGPPEEPQTESPIEDPIGKGPEGPPPPGEPPVLEHRCHAFHNDDVKCKNDGCEYDLANKKCVAEIKECPTDYWDGYTDCIRHNTHNEKYIARTLYNMGGVLCESKMNNSVQCTSASQAWGINFNAKTFFWNWRKTIYYKETSQVVDDPDGIIHRRMVVAKSACHLDNLKSLFWNNMMGPVVTADKTKLTEGKQSCVSYYFKVCGSGVYDLAIWIFEGISTDVNQRCFDIKIGDLTVLRSVDPYRISGRECGRLEFIVLFKVSDDGKELLVRGFDTPVPIEDKEKIPLRLCSGTCGAQDLTFQVSAASVHKHGAEPCPKKYENRCHEFHDDDTACRDAGCEYDLDKKKCPHEKQRFCPDDFWDGYTDCIRFEPSTPVFYNHGGVLCQFNTKTNTRHKNECPSATQVWGIDFGNNAYNYRWRKTIYLKEKDHVIDDPHGMKINTRVSEVCNLYNNDEWWVFFYGTAVTVDETKITKGEEQCVTYYFRVCTPGIHELAIWINEESTISNLRCFDIKMGDLTILKSIDPFSIIGRKCARSQIITLFNVMDNMKELYPKGFSTPVRFDDKNKIPLRLCTGTCGNPDVRFVVSAASIHKHWGEGCKPKMELDNYCHTYHGDPIACKGTGCEYDLTKGKCVGILQYCPKDFWDGYTSCIRVTPGKKSLIHLYNHGGVLCRNWREDAFECSAAKQSWGVNFGGNTATDNWRQTYYSRDESLPKTDPQGIRLPTRLYDTRPCNWAGEAYDNIFNPIIKVNKDKVQEGQQSCVTYYFKVCKPGIHELSLWAVDVLSNGTNQRCFDVKMGDLTVLQSFDPRRISNGFCDLYEIVILFHLYDNMKDLYPKGFNRPVKFTDLNRIPLSLCTGACGIPAESFQLIAASVHKHWGDGC